MTQALRMWLLLTGLHKYDKSLSTRNRGHGEIADPAKRDRYYDPESFPFGPPEMREEDRIPHHLERLGLTAADVDVVFVGHLHFDHAGGLCDVCGDEVHVQQDALDAARSGLDIAVVGDDFAGIDNGKVQQECAELWPNHDLAFWRRLRRFPEFHE